MRSDSQGGESSNAPEYRQVFLIHVHRLLQIGYSRLVPVQFANTKEPVISGRIRKEIDDFLDEPPAEGWKQFYEVFNENPEDDEQRVGNDRLKTDIRIKSSHTAPRLRFIFEAKRLRDSRSVRDYLGPEGLRAFLNEDYAKDSLDAGMLGYVQVTTAGQWASGVGNKLKSAGWKKHNFSGGPAHTYVSRHARTSSGKPIDVYHTFLLFC